MTKPKAYIVNSKKRFELEREQWFEWRKENDFLNHEELKSKVRQAELSLERAREELNNFHFTTKEEFLKEYNYKDWYNKVKEQAEKKGVPLEVRD